MMMMLIDTCKEQYDRNNDRVVVVVKVDDVDADRHLLSLAPFTEERGAIG